MSFLIRRSGLLVSFFAAAVLAVVPSGSARADVAPPEPMDDVVAGPPGARGADGAAGDLAAKLVRAGMPPEEARALVAGLAPEERLFLAERAESAEVGGFVLLVPLVPFFIFAGIIAGVMAIFGALDAAGGDEAPKPDPDPSLEPPVARQVSP